MAEPVVLASAVQSVNVFRSGAVVKRIARIAGKAWPEEIALEGLPLSLDDESVRVSLVGATKQTPLPRPSDVRVTLVIPEAGQPLVPPSEKELQDAADEVRRLQTKVRRIDREVGQLDEIHISLPEAFENRPPRPAPTAAWQGVLEWTQKAKRVRVDERAKLKVELMRAQEAYARLQRRDAEARAKRDSRDDAVKKRVVLRLREAGAFSEANLFLEYMVPGARWVPTYTFRMGKDGRTASLAVRALVVQRSGEPWDRVKLAVSTADLLRETEIPELKSLRIGRKQPLPPKRAWRDAPTGSDSLFEGLDLALASMRPPPPVAPPAVQAPMPPPPPPPPEPEMKPVATPDVTGAMTTPLGGMAMGAGGAVTRGAPGGAPSTGKRDDAKKSSAPPAMERSVNRPMMPATQAAPRRAPSPAPNKGGRAMSMDKVGDARAVDDHARMEEAERYDLDEDGAMPMEEPEPEPAALAPDSGALKYADRMMSGWDGAHARGKLRPVTIVDRLAGVDSQYLPSIVRQLSTSQQEARAAASVSFPAGTTGVESSSGSFDHRYDAEGLVDVPSDGKIHNVPLFLRSAPVATTLIVVPRESDQAVRVAAMKNPLEAPLLAGPAEIYLEDEFLVTSPIRTVPAGAELKIGLGVEEALKVARNTFFEEETHGLLGGGATLSHRVEIEIASRLSVPVKVEVRERVPVKDELDKEIEITVPVPAPAWEEWDQADTGLIKGGRRWKVTLGPGESKKLAFAYTVKIDGKNEVVGGNRRE